MRVEIIKMNMQKGISVIEILISIAIISFVFLPAIQILFSLRSAYILEIVRDEPHDAKNMKNIQQAEYYGAGQQRSIYKKGGFGDSALLTEHFTFNGDSVPGIHSRQSCSDFTDDIDTTKTPILHLYTPQELSLSSTTKVTGVSFIGDAVFLSTDSSSTTQPDLLQYRLDSQSLEVKPNFTLVHAQDSGPGISQLQTIGLYAVTANTGVKNQVNIFQIYGQKGADIGQSGSSTWSRIDFTIPGSNSSTTPITKNVLYADGRIIIGTEKSVLPEIFIFNASNGQVEGSIETGYGINDMLILNNLLIVAGPSDPEIESYNLKTLQKEGEYDLPGGSGNAKTLTIFGNRLHVGRTKGGNEFQMLDVARLVDSPVAPFTSVFTPSFGKKIQWSIDALLKSGVYTMLLTADEYGEFKLYKEHNGTPEFVYTVDLPYRASSALCLKNSIWVTFRDVESQNPYVLGFLTFE